MIKTHQIEFESILFLLFAAILGISSALFFEHRSQPQRKFYIPVLETTQTPIPSPTPAPTPLLPLPIITSQVSPDGTHKLTLTTASNRNLTKTYIFATSNSDGTDSQTIYTMNSADDSMNIPFNTWSPDNKYVFLNLQTATGTQAIVMNADGTPLTAADQNLNVTLLFNAQNTGNNYVETTGWASNTLLIVNSTTPAGVTQSYWFEVPTQAVIPLSSQF